MAVDSKNERLYYTSNSGGADNHTVFVYDGPTGRIGRFIVDVTNLSSSECPSAACSNLQVGGTRGLNDAGAEYNAGRLFLGAENVSGNVDRIYYIDIDEVDSRVNGTFPPKVKDTGLLFTFPDTANDWGDIVVKTQTGVTNPDQYYLYSIDRAGGRIFRIPMDNSGPPYTSYQVINTPNTGQGTITQGDRAFILTSSIQEINLDTGAAVGSAISYTGVWPSGDQAYDATSCVNPYSSLPVSLNSFDSDLSGNRLKVDWTTASETFNVGFSLWAKVNGSWRLLTHRPVLSKSMDAVTPQQYHAEVPLRHLDPREIDGLAIASIETTGKQELYGLFDVGKAYGEKSLPDPIPWRRIRMDYINRMVAHGLRKTRTEMVPWCRQA